MAVILLLSWPEALKSVRGGIGKSDIYLQQAGLLVGLDHKDHIDRRRRVHHCDVKEDAFIRPDIA